MVDLSEPFERPEAYHQRLRFYLDKADPTYRVGAALKLAESAQHALQLPSRRLNVAHDALRVLRGNQTQNI